jgi:hypothetical protein
VNGERERLTEAVARLEEAVAALRTADVEQVEPDDLTRLAEAVVALSAEIGERVPRLIAEAEAAAEGAGEGAAEPGKEAGDA